MTGLAVGTGWERGTYWGGRLDEAIIGLKKVNSNTAQFSFYIRQIGLDATKATYFSDVYELQQSIRRAKAAGLKVFLKPVVDVALKDGSYAWRGNIKGSNTWFKRVYIPFILHMARIAREESVDVLSVGSELRDSEFRVGQWRNVIRVARSQFKGNLTYVANHDVSFQLWFSSSHIDLLRHHFFI